MQKKKPSIFKKLFLVLFVLAMIGAIGNIAGGGSINRSTIQKETVDDSGIPKEKFDNYRVTVQLTVESMLKYDDKAEWGARSKWGAWTEDGYDLIQTKFTAKNGFNADVNSLVTAKFERDTEKIVSLIIDGKEYIE